jgi:hypothetical protein
MIRLFEPDKEAVRHERAVTSLCDRTGAPLAEVRSLFAQRARNVASERRVVPRKTAVHDQAAPIRSKRFTAPRRTAL